MQKPFSLSLQKCPFSKELKKNLLTILVEDLCDCITNAEATAIKAVKRNMRIISSNAYI
jgi:hypothetical protein